MAALTSGSLCIGIGGLDIAAEHVLGTELAWYSEIEPAAVTIIERNWPNAPNIGDLTTVDWQTVPPIDVLTAGYPCQPFSHAGKRQGANDARHLWPHIINAIRVLRPSLVVLENVAGHLSLGFDTVLGDLAETGFDAEWCLLRASDVGACHQRARLFIAATNTDSEPAGRNSRTAPCPQTPDAGRSEPHDGQRPANGDRTATQAAPFSDTAGARSQGSAGRRVQPIEPCAGHREPVAAADTDSGRLQECPQLDSYTTSNPTHRNPRGRHADGRRDEAPVAWGDYGPAVERWAAIIGRPAPAPTDTRGRLEPAFVEWMMGYPAGWTAGLTRTAALKALGNAVVPLQGAHAIRLLTA